MSYPMYFPEGFDLQKAVICSKLVMTAYDMFQQWDAQDKPDKDDFHWEPQGLPIQYSAPIWGTDSFLYIFKTAEPFAFVAQNTAGTTYLVFRGTSSAKDFVKDAKADQDRYSLVRDFGSVHSGFLSIYKSMADDVAAALANVDIPITSLYVTGHSLGCGLSTCAVPQVMQLPMIQDDGIPTFHYNLASPRVGDVAFGKAYAQLHVPTYRVVNTCDLVPEVPTAVFGEDLYQHVGIPVNYTAQYGSLVDNHSEQHSYLYALQHPHAPANL